MKKKIWIAFKFWQKVCERKCVSIELKIPSRTDEEKESRKIRNRKTRNEREKNETLATSDQQIQVEEWNKTKQNKTKKHL